jgi:hypothetical protein
MPKILFNCCALKRILLYFYSMGSKIIYEPVLRCYFSAASDVLQPSIMLRRDS